MDRKYLSHPFDMSEYLWGQRFVVGGLDLKLDEPEAEEKPEEKPATPPREREGE